MIGNAVMATVVIAGLGVCCANAHATVRQLTCREWANKKYMGLYAFSFDDLTKDFSIHLQPDNSTQYGLFGAKVKDWKVLFEHVPRLVVFGIVTDDWALPVKVISLDFSRPQMFTYEMGGPVEGDEVIDNTQRNCVRTD